MTVIPLAEYDWRMDDLQLVKTELEKLRLSDLDSVAHGSGVPVDTIIKLKYGTTRNPRYETVKPLADHFRKIERDRAAA